MEETRGLGDDGRIMWEVVDKDGAGFVEGEEGAWEGRLCEEVGREMVGAPAVQKPPSEVAATADEEGAIKWAPASEAVKVEVGAIWGEGAGNRWRAGRWEQRGGKRMGGRDELIEGTGEHQRSIGIWAELRA